MEGAVVVVVAGPRSRSRSIQVPTSTINELPSNFEFARFHASDAVVGPVSVTRSLLVGGGVVCVAALASIAALRHLSRGDAEERESDVPATMEQVQSAAFVTRVLQRSCSLDASVRVRVVHTRPLDGGVHYEVAQLSLSYEDAGSGVALPAVPPGAPLTVVVKLFTGQPLRRHERLLLKLDRLLPPRVARWLWPTLHATGLRVHSYTIESRLYLRYTRLLSIPTPRAFYCHGDADRMTFVVLLEDLSGMDRGEPDGFRLAQSEHLVRALARFHRSGLHNAELPLLLATDDKFWQYGGYWFGAKEMLYGSDVVSGAEHLIAAFRTALTDSDAAMIRYAARSLARVSGRLTAIVHSLAPRVLLHGDYKISNLFIDGDDKVFAIDWQWLGGGFPATDLAYFVYTSVQYTDLVPVEASADTAYSDSMALAGDGAPPADSAAAAPLSERERFHYYGDAEWRLMRVYYDALDAAELIPFELFERAYRLNVIYFSLFCMRCKYNWLTPAHMARYSSVPEDGLHLRKIEHLRHLLRRTAVLLKHSPSLWH